MKYRIEIHCHNQRVYKGKPLSMPIREQAIKDMSDELFNDPDPCIIHQSYARQKIADRIMDLFPKESMKNIPLANYRDRLGDLDIEHLEDCFMDIEVKK